MQRFWIVASLRSKSDKMRVIRSQVKQFPQDINLLDQSTQFLLLLLLLDMEGDISATKSSTGVPLVSKQPDFQGQDILELFRLTKITARISRPERPKAVKGEIKRPEVRPARSSGPEGP